MSARDEAIEAGAGAIDGFHHPDHPSSTAGEWAAAVLDAAHASGAIVYADELEQVGAMVADEADPEYGLLIPWRGHGEPVFRKRPQEPNDG